jgi:cell division protein FtsA
MPGMQELAEDVFCRSVRIGVPQYTGSLADVVRNPRFSTVIGLLHEAKKQVMENQTQTVQPVQFKDIWKRMTSWFF